MSESGSPRGVRVAVVGSGLAGLSAAYFLANTPSAQGKSVRVELFERHEKLGMDAESVSVERNGRSVRVDVPMRAFSQGYYPELLALYRSINIAFQPSRFTFAFATGDESLDVEKRAHGPDPIFLYNGRRNGKRYHMYPKHSSLFGALYSAWYLLTIGISYLLLNFLANYHSKRQHTTDPNHPISKLTFSTWCTQSWISSRFTDDLLFPMFGSIMTTDMDAVQNLPASEVLEYIARTFFSPHFTVHGGVARVVEALCSPIPAEQLHLGVSILDIAPTDTDRGRCIMIRVKRRSGQVCEFGPFDHVVFASQATQTSSLLRRYQKHLHDEATASDRARVDRMLAAFESMRYENSTVVCHTDASILPAQHRYWRDLNFVSPHGPHQDAKGQYTMATHIVWRDASSEDTPVIMQTTNPLPWLFPAESAWISKSTFERFVLTLRGRDARRNFFQERNDQRRYKSRLHESLSRLKLGPLQGRPAGENVRDPGIWVNGSWSFGVPLLEGCISSARLVCTELLQSEGFSSAHIQEAWKEDLSS